MIFTDTYPAMALGPAQLGLLSKYAGNVSKDPTNQKFRRIRLGNAKFAAVWEREEAKQLLAASGWRSDIEDGYLVLPGEADHTVFAMFVDELVQSLPAPTPVAAQPDRPQAAVASAPAKSAQGMSDKEKEFHESRRKALATAKRASDEKKRIRAQIESDRDQVSKRKLKDSKAKEKKFGANVSRYADIGVDLNGSAGG